MSKHDIEPTMQEVLNAINQFATHVDNQFSDIKTEVNQRFEQIDERFDRIEGRLTRVEQGMVTKDYLDEKLYDLKGDLTVLIRKEDSKLSKLVETLNKKAVLSNAEAQSILLMEPFPKA